MKFTSDFLASDSAEMEEILHLSCSDAGPSRSNPQPNYKLKQELSAKLSSIEAELKTVEEDIDKLKAIRETLLSDKMDIMKQLTSTHSHHSSRSVGMAKALGETGKTDYVKEDFEWTGEMKYRMKNVFCIQSFRLCQEGVCNANMDGRDIVCVMPTGGGKSLTYQLPALLNPGCTLVISPLISLITDQILHLQEFGVEAVMLTGATPKEQQRDIFTRLTRSAGVKGKGSELDFDKREIKLCYVTPEKIAKSKTFTSMLEKVASAGKLARIVIDEAHCVSQLGHDFRPDYKKLSILRQLFPRVPILALSATCPPKVLKDLLTTLRLKPVVNGSSATSDGTVYFSAPLYRKNLLYKVLPKPASASSAIQVIANYILERHKDDSGIVYCLSKKDAETVAQGLVDASNGMIRTGVYHADVNDGEKEGLHRRWRKGDVKVVCATIAFGLGIDKGDVRFVVHHSMSKSMDGYYQESGRAGRDGKDSDCVLYYRPQDATRLSALICGELEGQDKLHDMLRFAQDVEECRKLQFAKYFSASSSLSMSAWATAEADAHARCGHCDNCMRPPETVERRDVTVEAWQILKIMQSIDSDGGRVTLGMVADLVRGAGGGAYGTAGGGKRGKGKAKEKVPLDLDELAGGKVTLGKDETETLLVHLLLTQYLKESFHSTAYAINVYVQPGPNSLRLSRFGKEHVESGQGPRIMLTFVKRERRKAKSEKKSGAIRDVANTRGKKVRREEEEEGDDSEEEEEDNESDDFTVPDKKDVREPQPDSRRKPPLARDNKRSRLETSSENEDEWAFSLAPPRRINKLNDHGKAAGPSRTSRSVIEDEVIILSD